MNISDNAQSALNLASPASNKESDLASLARNGDAYVGVPAGVTSNSNLDNQVGSVARKGAMPVHRKGGTQGTVRQTGKTRK